MLGPLFAPMQTGNVLTLVPAPQAIRRVPGRFLVTAVLVLDRH